jgi:hypothetical protein
LIITDPDIFIRKASKPDAIEYYEFLLTYVDDCLYERETSRNNGLYWEIYGLKDMVELPERYLRANIKKWYLPDSREVWSMSGKDYARIRLQLKL